MGLNFTYDLRTGKLVAIVPGTQRPSRYTVAGRPICRHLGPVTGETRVCPSCRGHVEVKVHKCSIYEECTTDKKVSDLHCCNPSDKCPSYMPLEVIEDSTTQRRVDLTHQRNLARFYPKVDKDYIAAGLKISREELDRATFNQGLSITHWRELMGAAKDKFSPGSLGLTLSEMGCTGCCGGGGSGSGSGSGGGGIQTNCCAQPIPSTLYGTVTNISGCSSMVTNYTLQWFGDIIPEGACGLPKFTNTFFWGTVGEGRFVACNSEGTGIAIYVACGIDNNWYLCAWDAGETDALPLAASSVSCGPPLVITWDSLSVVECCSGTVNLVVSSNPP